MTTVAMPYTNKIVMESSKEIQFSFAEAKFGDGYSQVSPIGINNAREYWKVTWGALTLSETITLMNTLKSTGPWGYFTWTPCGETIQKKFRLEGDQKVTQTRSGVSSWNISASFRQCFDL